MQYHVDGALVARTRTRSAMPMRALASDFNPGGAALVTVDVIRWDAAVRPGRDVRVADRRCGGVASWGAAQWSSAMPASTSLALAVRTGPTPVPDGSWSAFAALGAPGASVGQTAATRSTEPRSRPVTPTRRRGSSTCLSPVAPRVCGNGILESTEQCDDGNLVSGDGCTATCQDETLDSDGDGIRNIFETGTGIYVSPINTGTNPNRPTATATA